MCDVTPPPLPPKHVNAETVHSLNSTSCCSDGSVSPSDSLTNGPAAPPRSTGLLGDYPGSVPIKSISSPLLQSPILPGPFQSPKPSGPFQSPKPSGSFQSPKPSGPFQSTKPSGPFQSPRPSGPFRPLRPRGPFQCPEPFESPKLSGPFRSTRPHGRFRFFKPAGQNQSSRPSGPFRSPRPFQSNRPPRPRLSVRPSTSFQPFNSSTPSSTKPLEGKPSSPPATTEPAPPGIEESSPQKAEEPPPPGTEDPSPPGTQESEVSNIVSSILTPESATSATYQDEFNTFMGEEWSNEYIQSLYDAASDSCYIPRSKPHRATIRHVFYPKTAVTALTCSVTTTTFTTSPTKLPSSDANILTSAFSTLHPPTYSGSAVSYDALTSSETAAAHKTSSFYSWSADLQTVKAAEEDSSHVSKHSADRTPSSPPATSSSAATKSSVLSTAQWETMFKSLAPPSTSAKETERFVGPMLPAEMAKVSESSVSTTPLLAGFKATNAGEDKSTSNVNNNARTKQYKDYLKSRFLDSYKSARSVMTPTFRPKHVAKTKSTYYTELQEIPGVTHVPSERLIEVYTVNEILAREPEQSASTMFRLLIWEMYYHYFALRPISEMNCFLMAVLYQILTHQTSVTAMYSCGVCKVKNMNMQLMEYVIHTQTPQHAQNMYNLIQEKQQYGWKALIDSAGLRGWFCEVCPDVEWKQNMHSDDFLKHCSSSAEHRRRLLLIQAFADESQSLQDDLKAKAPPSAKVRGAQKKFELMHRFQIENWMCKPNCKKKFVCSLNGCKEDKNPIVIEDFLRHCERYVHMLNLYLTVRGCGSDHLFSQYLQFDGYKDQNKKYLCGICPIRRPADDVVIDSLLDHMASKEHARNVELLKILYDREDRGCLYTCTKQCRLVHVLETSKTTRSTTKTASKSRTSYPSLTTTSTLATANSLASLLNINMKGAAPSPAGPNTPANAAAEKKILNNQKGNFPKIQSLTPTTATAAVTVAAVSGKVGQVVSDSKLAGNGSRLAGPLYSATKGKGSATPYLSADTVQGILQSVKSADMRNTPFHTAMATAQAISERCRKSNESLDNLSVDSSTPKTNPSGERSKNQHDIGGVAALTMTINTEKNSEAAAIKLKPGIKSLVSRDYETETTKERPDKPPSSKQYTHQYTNHKFHSKVYTSSKYQRRWPEKVRKRVNDNSSSSHRRSNSQSRSKRYRSRSRSRSGSLAKKSKSKWAKKTFKNRYKSRSRSHSDDSTPERRSTSRHSSGSRGGTSLHKKPRHSFHPTTSSYSRKKRYHRSRSRSYSSVSERTARSSRSSPGRKASRRRSRSFESSSDSSSSYSSRSSSSGSNRHRFFSGSRSKSLSRSPRARRRLKRSRSRSKSLSLGMKRSEAPRLLRHISPPPFPLNNNSIYWIDPTSERLSVRSLSPVSADVVSRTVENAWNFYHSRYYSQPALSSDIVYDSQVLFLKSYSGFFTKPSKFENCFKTLYKPEDLKTALRLRLDRLSPGPPNAAKNSGADSIGSQSECQNNLVTSSLAAEEADRSNKRSSGNAHASATNSAKTLETLIKTGVVPGLTLIEDSQTFDTSSHSAQSLGSTNSDGIRYAIQSLRQSFSESGTKPSGHDISDHTDLDTLTEAEAEATIPFLNDGTVAEIQKSHTCDGKNEVVEAIPRSVELPWHYCTPVTPVPSDSDGDERMRASTATSCVDKSSTVNQRSTVSQSSLTTTTSVSMKGEQNSATAKKEKCEMVESLKTEDDILMSVFISEVVKGIIRLSTLQGSAELSAEQVEVETELEQEKMHSRMITAAGHYMIHMARCRLSAEPDRLLTDFKDADEEAIELMQTLDVRVIELIAGTPLLDD